MIRLEFPSTEQTTLAYETLLSSGVEMHMVLDESNAPWAVEISPDHFTIAMEILAQHDLNPVDNPISSGGNK